MGLAAERLGVNRDTVKKYLWHLYMKLGVHSAAGALWKILGEDAIRQALS